MGFILFGMPPFGGSSGFAPAGARTLAAAGYPVTLAKPKSLQSITIYGNDGGVGDVGENLINSAVQGNFSMSAGKLVTASTAACGLIVPCKPNTAYTIYRDPVYGNRFRLATTSVYPADGVSTVLILNGPDTDNLGYYRFTTASNAAYLYIYLATVNTDTVEKDTRSLRLVKGSVSRKEIAAVRYGYKIPVVIGDKTINLYSSAALGTSDTLSVNISDKTAELTVNGTTTNISDMQDWTQDFTLPNVDELTVTADTSVEPSKIEIAYKGRR